MLTLDWFCGGEEFYNWNKTFSSETPLFSNCFNGLVFRLVPCLVLWIFAFPYILWFSNGKDQPLRTTIRFRVKQLLFLILFILGVMETAYVLRAAESTFQPPVDYITPLIISLSMLLALGMTVFDQKKGLLTSGLLTVFLFCNSFMNTMVFYLRVRDLKKAEELFVYKAIVFFIFYFFVVISFFLTFFVDSPKPMANQIDVGEDEKLLDRGNSEKEKLKRKQCPEHQSSFISQIFFSWFTSMAILGNKKPLEDEDLWDLNPEDRSEVVVERFLMNWNQEVEKHEKARLRHPDVQATVLEGGEELMIKTGNSKKRAKKPSLNKVLIKTFGPYYSFSIILKFTQDCLAFVGPQLLEALITYTRSDNPAWQGYLIAFSLFGAAALQTLFLQRYFHICFIVGMQIRSSIITSVYRKAIKLSNSSRKGSTVGEIVNLMSVDAQRLLDLVSYLNIMWSGPLQIFLAVYFLWQQLGPSVLAGVAVMVLLIPINGFVASRARRIHVKQMEYKDHRMKMMHEVLNGMKALKMYAWELMFKGKVMETREKELRELRRAAWLQAITSFTFVCAPFLVSFASFGVYVLSDEKNILTAEKTFVSLSLFHLLRFPLLMLPNMITSLVQASVSIKRIRNFLCNEEIDLLAVDRKGAENGPDVAIRLRHSSFRWANDDPSDTLKDISVDIKKGKLVAVVGQVGCGKSSLLAAILGDMYKQNGYVGVKGDIAYVAQQSWIQNLTVRNNILFGKNKNSSNYRQVVKDCELQSDLDMLPAGDNTEIGERGINLSGGQKQRVSIARAVFQNADIYLFDDPLSAVDAHVGRNIFDNVIGPNGCLAGKTRVLVTHGISYLPDVDQIIVIDNGTISETGSYDELIEKNGAFADFMKSYTYDGDEDGVDKTNNRTKINLRSSKVKMPEDEQEMRLRKKSISSKEPESEMSEKKKIYEAEKSETGNVSLKVYLLYMKCIGYFLSAAIIFCYFLQNVCLVAASIWLSMWAEDPINPDGTRNGTMERLTVYGALGVAQSLCAFASSVMLFLSAINAAGAIHYKMLDRLMQTPLSFFDVTPIGRIINRCGKDTDIMDDILIRSVSAVLACFWRVVATIFVICYATYYFAIALPPIFIIYYFIQRFFVKTSRQLRRLQSVSRSPIFSHFAETLTGASTVRAYSRQPYFIQQNEQQVDNNQMSYYPNIVSNRWLALRLEMITNFIVLLAALFAVIERGNVNPSIVGLSVSYAMQVTQTFNWMVRMTSEMESNIVAVERIEEYTHVEQEAAYYTDKKPDKSWPQAGAVEFRNYSTRYRRDLDLVVHNINFKVNGGEKIGIVGRTGAGKSSLTLALFRIIEASDGQIIIDGHDISKIGLMELRSKLSIIPQEPTLFSGTLRFNLDPFEAFTDAELWETLRHSHLHAFVTTLPDKLLHVVSEGGENLSVGQRQLVCLARALLRKSRILVLDEATAAVDLETDDLIQTTIHSLFKEATTFTIAHRLNTIMESTRILVLDNGRIVQFASPDELLLDTDGIFYHMALDAGIV